MTLGNKLLHEKFQKTGFVSKDWICELKEHKTCASWS